MDHAEAVDAIRDALVVSVAPIRIILFGSRARGSAGEQSDYDLLVVVDSGRPSWEVGLDARLAMRSIRVPMDLIVLTPRELDEELSWSSSVISHAVRTGRVIYEAPA